MDFWGRKPENDFIRAFEEVTEGHENNHESQLSTERMEELEIQIQQDEKPIKLEPDESGLSEPERGKKKLKRELRKEALTRMEEAARTEADFEKVTQAWDKLDANRERKERYHEIKRSGRNRFADFFLDCLMRIHNPELKELCRMQKQRLLLA